MRRLCCIAFTLLVAASVHAQQTNYVTDDLSVTVRTGRGNDYQILRTIRTGTPVEVLQVTDDGYARVRLQDGVEGWMLTRFLTDSPVARERLSAVQDQLDELRGQNARLSEQLDTLEQTRSELEGQLTGMQEERARLVEENRKLKELSELPEELQAKNKALQQQLDDLGRETRLLREKTARLQDTSLRNWFLAGAGVLLAGLLIGAVAGRMMGRRRSTFGGL